MNSFVGRSQDVVVINGRRRKIIIVTITCVACIIVAAGIFMLLVNSFLNKQYKSYKVIEETKINISTSDKYLSYNGKIIKYSRDGISAVDASGNIIWNGSYDMISPAVDICGKYVVVADIGAKSFFVYNEEGQAKEIVTDYPITQACVSIHGIVAVLLEQANSNVINIYDPYNISARLLVEIPTNVDEGYPVCIDISPEGTNLIASYVCVTSGNVQSRVAFYDFTDVGKNTNCLVGAKNYDESIISDVRFLGSDKICIFADNGFSIWENPRQPGEVYSKTYKTKIKSAFCNEKYVGMVFENSNKGKPYQMKVYDMSGSKVLDMGFNNEYSTIRMYDNNEIILNSTSECTIFRVNGIKKFSCNIDGKVLYLFPDGGINKYYLIMESKIQKIKMEKQKS